MEQSAELIRTCCEASRASNAVCRTTSSGSDHGLDSLVDAPGNVV